MNHLGLDCVLFMKYLLKYFFCNLCFRNLRAVLQKLPMCRVIQINGAKIGSSNLEIVAANCEGNSTLTFCSFPQRSRAVLIKRIQSLFTVSLQMEIYACFKSWIIFTSNFLILSYHLSPFFRNS